MSLPALPRRGRQDPTPYYCRNDACAVKHDNPIPWHTESPSWNLCSAQTLAKLCIALAECCQRIPYSLDCQYGTQPGEDDFGKELVMQSFGGTPGSKRVVASSNVEELERWHNALPRGLQRSQVPLLCKTNYRFNDTIIIHRAIHNGACLAAKSALCRSGFACVETIPKLKFDVEYEASSLIMNMFYQLNANGLIRYLPDIVIAVLKSAITAETSHGIDISVNGSMSQRAFCLPSDVTIPALSAPITERYHELEHAARLHPCSPLSI